MNRGAISILMSDVVMPKRSGKEVLDEIRSVKPDIKSLFLSGYTENIVHKKGILDIGMNFIQKPFSPDVLVKKVREILDGQSAYNSP